jgi:hypothetical protein
MAQRRTKLVQEGDYAATVDSPVETDEGWSPYLTLEDAEKLDRARETLRYGDIKAADQLARVLTIASGGPLSIA